MSIHEKLALSVLILGGIIAVATIFIARNMFRDLTELHNETQSFWEETRP